MTWPPIPVMHGHGDPTQFATNHLPQYQGFVECVLTTNNCIYAGESEPYTFFFGGGECNFGGGWWHPQDKPSNHAFFWGYAIILSQRGFETFVFAQHWS